MVGPARLRALLAGAAIVLVVPACGETTTETRTPAPNASTSPGADATADPRAEASTKDKVDKQARRAQDEARCAELRRSVKVAYRVMTRPVSTGQEIWLRITVRNDTDHYVGGPFSGLLRVTAAHPGQPLPMSWGGSSADEAGAEAQRTFVHQILNLDAQPLQTPADARVTDVDIDYTNLQLCQMPARLRAPEGLVAEHPSGRWYVTPTGEEVSSPSR